MLGDVGREGGGDRLQLSRDGGIALIDPLVGVVGDVAVEVGDQIGHGAVLLSVKSPYHSSFGGSIHFKVIAVGPPWGLISIWPGIWGPKPRRRPASERRNSLAA